MYIGDFELPATALAVHKYDEDREGITKFFILPPPD